MTKIQTFENYFKKKTKKEIKCVGVVPLCKPYHFLILLTV